MATNTPPSRALVAFPFGHPHSQVPRSPSPHSILSSRSPLESDIGLSSNGAQDQGQWQPILHASNQVVLYNPRSHALSITSVSAPETLASGVVVARRIRREEESIASTSMTGDTCPYCKQDLPIGFGRYPGASSSTGEGLREHGEADDSDGTWRYHDTSDDDEESGEIEAVSTDPAYHSRASDYFRLLAIVNETSSAASGSRRPSISPTRYRSVVDGSRDEDDTRWSNRRSRSRSRRSRTRTRTPDNRSTKGAFPADKMAEGYFKTFFQEEYKLGMGANGSVFLCQHLLDGNPLGHFAVKKIAVGESHSYLLKILREVRLLERLHHPNIITYHHAWLETAQFSSFGPKVPTLHVLMQWAEGGSLDDFIDVRLGRKPAHIHMHPHLSSTSSAFQASVPPSPASSTNELPSDNDPGAGFSHAHHTQFHDAESAQQQHSNSKPEDPQSRAARIKAFRAYQRAPPEEKEQMRREMERDFGGGSPTTHGALNGLGGPERGEWTPVHLLSAEEVKSLFQDVVAGLGFLHDRSILHLDLKPGNVLLTWDEGQLIPRAMLSDFGTSRDMINSSRAARSGNTGTLEYTAPESLPAPHTGLLQQIDSKADMWSLGMILHKILFFKLPYRYAAVGDANGEPISRNEEGEKMDRLEKEVFKSNPDLVTGFEARRLPRSFLVLLENLLHKNPGSRPNCERVNVAIRAGKFDPLGDIPSQGLPLARPWTDTSAPTSPTPNEGTSMELASLAADKSQRLALPSPVEVLGPEEGSWRSWFTWNTWRHFVTGVVFRRDNHRRKKKARILTERDLHGHGGMGMRLIRSSLLVVKILTIPRLCPNSMTRPRPVIVALLLAAAVADTVIDHDAEPPETMLMRQDSRGRGKTMGWRMRGVWVTLGLGLLHVGVLGLSALRGGWETACCIPLDSGLRDMPLGR
ncbi:hypothetical protein GALMADRAFT_142947 [Galerina marginata CBS 339.88]|uniref:non-specific serine/threonine protein kinase n=1 Tax=Galerina marginata (strain CBS 339.88) TaxID=685588 RepID=A0A067SY77_GALM3|nr:hypothetical protein GALMADRAFT_142947 [Galerina marginata CBS 339.88]